MREHQKLPRARSVALGAPPSPSLDSAPANFMPVRPASGLPTPGESWRRGGQRSEVIRRTVSNDGDRAGGQGDRQPQPVEISGVDTPDGYPLVVSQHPAPSGRSRPSGWLIYVHINDRNEPVQ